MSYVHSNLQTPFSAWITLLSNGGYKQFSAHSIANNCPFAIAHLEIRNTKNNVKAKTITITKIGLKYEKQVWNVNTINTILLASQLHIQKKIYMTRYKTNFFSTLYSL